MLYQSIGHPEYATEGRPLTSIRPKTKASPAQADEAFVLNTCPSRSDRILIRHGRRAEPGFLAAPRQTNLAAIVPHLHLPACNKRLRSAAAPQQFSASQPPSAKISFRPTSKSVLLR
jgi:hypothetical protein